MPEEEKTASESLVESLLEGSPVEATTPAPEPEPEPEGESTAGDDDTEIQPAADDDAGEQQVEQAADDDSGGEESGDGEPEAPAAEAEAAEDEGLTPALVTKAARLGLEDEDILACETDAELERSISLAQRFGAGKPRESEDGGEKPGAKPDAQPELDIELPAFELPDGYDEDDLKKAIADRDTAMVDNVKKGVQGFLDGRLAEIQQAVQLERDINRFDFAVNALPEQWDKTLGKGYRDDLGQSEAENRAKLFDAAAGMLESAQAKGQRMSMTDAVKRALAVEFGEEAKTHAAAVKLKKVAKRTKIRKPGGAQTKPLSDEDQMVADVGDGMRKVGISFNEVSSENDLESILGQK